MLNANDWFESLDDSQKTFFIENKSQLIDEVVYQATIHERIRQIKEFDELLNWLLQFNQDSILTSQEINKVIKTLSDAYTSKLQDLKERIKP